jgi:hypothetical protein
MKSIQVILVILSLMTGILGSSVFHSKLFGRLIAASLFCLSIVLVLLPDLTTDLARKLGVGRGTDLLFYTVFFAGIQAFLLLYARTRKLERKLTESIRAIAIRDAAVVEAQPPCL